MQGNQRKYQEGYLDVHALTIVYDALANQVTSNFHSVSGITDALSPDTLATQL